MTLYWATCFSTWYVCFFFNDPAPTEIYTLSLHDALPICFPAGQTATFTLVGHIPADTPSATEFSNQAVGSSDRSEEHTSELQSQSNLVCRLLLEKKKQ